MNKFFSHPNRAFFAAFLFFGALACVSFFAPIDFVSAHKALFILISPAFAYGGFLLIALPDWLNFTGSIKSFSIAIFSALFIAFFASFFSLQICAAVVSLYFFALFCFALFLAICDRNSDQFAVLFLLLFFCLNLALLSATGDEKFLISTLHINSFGILIISFRVSVVLGDLAIREANLKDTVFVPNGVYKNIAATIVALYAAIFPFVSPTVSGFVAIGVGFLLLAKLRELHYFTLLRRHYLFFYYCTQLLGSVGYLWLGICGVLGANSTPALHFIALLYFFATIFLIFCIASLRHSGFLELNFAKFGYILFSLLLLSAIFRTLLWQKHIGFHIHAPAFLLLVCFILLGAKFIPIFIKHEFSDDPE